MTDPRPTVLYDAGCNLCQGAVAFIRRHDRAGRFRFIPLGSPPAADLLDDGGCGGDTIFLLDGAGRHDRSTALVRIAAGLDRPWSVLRFLRLVPRRLRDVVYGVIARNRLTWFGRARTGTCRRD